MIGAVTVGGAVLKMGTAALMKMETHFDKPVTDVLSAMQTGFKMSDLAFIYSVCMDEGKGQTIDEAAELIDELGFGAAANALSDVAAAAFPEPEKGGDKGKKKAGQSKAD